MMHPPGGYESASPELSDIERHRARVFEALSRHSDPVLREIGRQLAAGGVVPHELLTEPRYVEALHRGVQETFDLNDEELRDRLLGGPETRPDHRGADRPQDRG